MPATVITTPRRTYARPATNGGWDNAPRLLTNGIWRPVYLEALPPCRFDQVYLYTRNITDDQVSLGFSWSYITPAKF